MTIDEVLSFIKTNGGFIGTPADERDIKIANSGLQNIRAAILPMFIIDLYKATGGVVMGGCYIFGPKEIDDPRISFPIPNIVQINNDISSIPHMRGKTVFARNDLFLFAFDAFGKCFMLDNITLNVLREYEDSYRAINDCLIIGKL